MASPAGSYSYSSGASKHPGKVLVSPCSEKPQKVRDGYVNRFGLTFTVSTLNIPAQRTLKDGLSLGSIAACYGRWKNTSKTCCPLGHRTCEVCIHNATGYFNEKFCRLCKKEHPELEKQNARERLDEQLQTQLKACRFTCDTCDTKKLSHTEMLKHTCPSKLTAPSLREDDDYAWANNDDAPAVEKTGLIVDWLRTLQYSNLYRDTLATNIDNELWFTSRFDVKFEDHRLEPMHLDRLYKGTSPTYIEAWDRQSNRPCTDIEKLALYKIHKHLRENCGCAFMDGEKAETVYPVTPYVKDEEVQSATTSAQSENLYTAPSYAEEGQEESVYIDDYCDADVEELASEGSETESENALPQRGVKRSRVEYNEESSDDSDSDEDLPPATRRTAPATADADTPSDSWYTRLWRRLW